MEDAEALAVTLEAHPDFRVLRRLDLRSGPTGEGREVVAGIGVVVDVETTGIDRRGDRIIELAMRRFAYDEDHVITRLDEPYVWREDPGEPLADEIVRLTGLTDADLAGRSIDEDAAARILSTADVRIAHNAAFDRPFVERRLPSIDGMPWACSLQDVGWTARGYDSGRLGSVLAQCGFFHGAHRALADVDATIQILRQELEPGVTALKLMLERAAARTWVVRAFGAVFESKDRLRLRGYRWDPAIRVWWREVQEAERDGEEDWLLHDVYRPAGRTDARQAGFEKVDWTRRYG